MSDLTELRRTAFAAAYKMTGAVVDAEDIAQEALLRWHRREQPGVRSPAAYVAKIAINLSLDRAKRAAAEREAIGRDWLPEPVVAPAPEPDFAYAAIVALQSLTPLERAVFLLRTSFDCDYDDIAATLRRRADACRKAMQRARRILRTGRPPQPPPISERLLRALVEAVSDGDVDRLRKLLAEDVVIRADGGAKGPALKRPLQGREAAIKFLIASRQLLPYDAATLFAVVGGEAAAVARVGDAPVLAIMIATDGGKIASVFAIGDAEKIARL